MQEREICTAAVLLGCAAPITEQKVQKAPEWTDLHTQGHNPVQELSQLYFSLTEATILLSYTTTFSY